MARTAPAPNIPPIPGMCPSLAVMAGGGDTASGGGGSGGQGDGSGGGNGDGSGNGANEDGAGAQQGQGNCPGGTPCPSHASSGGGASAGDPVDVVTGRVYTLPATDLFLPGRLPFHFTRQYSSSTPCRDVGFGPGWSHSLAWELEARRDGLRLWTDDGTFVRFDLLEPVGASTIGTSGWRLARTPRGYEAERNGITFAFDHTTSDGAAHQLTSIRDRNQATITIERDARDERAITGVVDSVGRRIGFTRDVRGRAANLFVALPAGGREVVAEYGYDDRGRLASVTDVLGSRWTYDYDEGDRLTAHRDPTGLTFHYVYDAEGRCVETWGDQHGAMPAGIMPDHPRRLADGTPVKGILHARITFGPGGYSEVSTSETTRRYFGNAQGKLDKEVHAGGPTTRTYDRLGFVSEVVDGEGLATSFERDHRGRVVRATDRLGRSRVLERLPTGEVVREIDPTGAVVTRTFDSFGNKLLEIGPDGATWAYRYDDGRLVGVMLPNGGAFQVKWDDHANLVELTEPGGGVWRSTYDFFGRTTSITSPLGVVRELVRDRAGRIVELRHDGATVRRESHDALGRIVERWTPDGGVTRYEHGAHLRIVRSVLPDGGEVRFLHDLENRVRRIINQKGEVHAFDVSRKGQLERERYFDGRENVIRHDAAGMMARSSSGPGRATELVHDPEGRLLSRSFGGGELVHTFTYDAMDRVLETTAPGVKVVRERDASGRVVRESFDVAGHAWSVATTFDPMGRVVRQAVEGHVELVLARDADGRVRRHEIVGAGAVDVERDGAGRMLKATLPGGGVWRRSWSAFDLIATQSVFDATGGGTVDTRFHYDAVQLLRERTDAAAPRRTYTYDLLRQLVSVRADGHSEDYTYDVTGNVSGGAPGAAPLTYGRGDRLAAVGSRPVTHDADGRIVSREDGGGRRWNYLWRPDGMLGRVTAPDGAVTESLYDAHGRRVLRTLFRGGKRVRTTGYVWSGETMLAELELEGAESRRVRTYLHHDHDGLVLAHFDRRDGVSAWRFYMSEPGGMPTRLVDETGRVAEDVDALAFGALRSPVRETELRFPGQIHDAEAGLHYNRHRHYDPELGRYLSPDPAGLWEGLNLYRYAGNTPTSLSDEDGLGCLVTITGTSPAGDVTSVSSTSSTGGDWSAPTPGGSVATAVTNTPAHQPSRAPWPPGTCAEASAVSRYLEQARAQPGNGDLTDRELLAQIPPGGITVQHHDNPSAGKRRTPCPNCRQMLMELGIHPENDARIAGNPRQSAARPLAPGRHGASLQT